MIKHILTRLARIEAAIMSLRPVSGPGIRVSRTTKGAVIQATGKAAPQRRQSTSNVPTWG